MITLLYISFALFLILGAIPLFRQYEEQMSIRRLKEIILQLRILQTNTKDPAELARLQEREDAYQHILAEIQNKVKARKYKEGIAKVKKLSEDL